MKATSPAYSPYADIRWVDFNIRFELLDETAKGAAVPSVSGQGDISQLAQLTDGIEEMSAKYATFETDGWKLDGTFSIVPDDLTGIQTGWWSDVLSDEDGLFLTPPSVSFYFGGAAIDTVGFTLCFDDTVDSYPVSIRVTTYDADQTTIIEQETFVNDNAKLVINMPVTEYYAVMFEFLSTSKPHRRVRLAECLFGIVQYFDNDNLISVQINYGADLTSESFPSRQLDFVFENLDKKYNLINPNSLYAYLQQGQDIYVRAVVNGEKVDMGVFEFTSAKASDDEMTGTITANDYVLLALDEALFTGGSNTVETLQTAVDTVLGDLDIETSLAYPSYQVSMAIPKNTTKREAIMLLAQAAMCSVWVDRDGILQIQPLTVKAAADDELNADRTISLGGISVSDPIDAVNLTVRNEFYVDINDDVVTVEHTYVAGSGKRVKEFHNPCVEWSNGQAVADWLLLQHNRRIRYNKQNRCNPAVEIGDTLKIHDAYGENRNAVVVEQEISYNGILSANTRAIG